MPANLQTDAKTANDFVQAIKAPNDTCMRPQMQRMDAARPGRLVRGDHAPGL